ncbi:hypothetical protein AB0H60_06740 [Nocardia rhamnosiphila]|uniref:AbiTii domain-containing protein n=1 Tax=Nocardia rhamnosiphila TaxID=426716 RepID=UPI00340909A5
MTLLQDVINDTQGTGPVAGLLRKLKVLATRTGAPEMLQWVNQELNGYPRNSPVPTYRGPFTTMPRAQFIGPAGFSVKNHVVRRSVFPEEAQSSYLFEMKLPHPVAEVESFAASEDETSFGWPAEALAMYNYLIEQGKGDVDPMLRCVGVRYSVPDHVFVGILDQIRNKALDLALELEAVAPDAGEPDASDDTKREARQVIVNYNFLGTDMSGANNAFGGSGFGQMLGGLLPGAVGTTGE